MEILASPGIPRDARSLPTLTRLDALLALAVFVASLLLYVRTLAPGLLWGDSAEFQTLASTLGMTHSTGYPVYLLVGKVFTWLPVGDIAYRVNLLSAVAGAGALALVYLLGRVLGGWRVAALIGTVALAVCDLFWWHAVMAELYSAAAALTAAILLLVVCWRATGNWRLLFAAGILGGLSIGVHITVALTAPAILLYLALTARRRADWLGALGGAVVGVVLAFAAFLFIDALDAPSGYYYTTLRYSWSVWYDSPAEIDAPWERLGFLLGARQFTWGMFRSPRIVMPEHAERYREFFSNNWAPAAQWLMALGSVITLLRRRGQGRAAWPEALLLVVAWLTMMGFILNYEIGDIFAFYVPTYIMPAVAVSLGAGALIDGVVWTSRRVGLASAAGAIAGVAGLLLFVPVLQPRVDDVRRSWQAERITFLDNTDLEWYPYPVREPTSAHDTASWILDLVAPNAMIFTDWGTVYAVYYVAHVERGETGISVHEWFVQDGVDGVAASLKDYIDANLDQRPIYFNEIPFDMPARFAFEQIDYDLPLYKIVGRR